MSAADSRLLRFLLVEDDEDHAEIVLHSLAEHRVSNAVDHVLDGEAALQYLRREGQYADSPRPDVILLDLKLPKLDGHEVLEQIKADHDLRSIPVVVLTTSDAESDRTRAYENFANSYLVKPLNFDQFNKMVEDLGLYWGVWNRSR